MDRPYAPIFGLCIEVRTEEDATLIERDEVQYMIRRRGDAE